MSKGILFFSVVAAALVIRVQLQEDLPIGLESPFAVKVNLTPEMEVYFAVGHFVHLDNFYVEFLTANCSIALRINFQPDQNNITMNTCDEQGWGQEEYEPFESQNNSLVEIKMTNDSFMISMVTRSAATGKVDDRLVIRYGYRLSLSSITHVLVNGGENYMPDFYIWIHGSELQIMDDWIQPNASAIAVYGNASNNFKIDLLTEDPRSWALKLKFKNYDKEDDIYKLLPGKKIHVLLLVNEDKYEMKVNYKKPLSPDPDNDRHVVDPHLVNRVVVKGLPDVYIAYIKYPQETEKPIPCRSVALNASDEAAMLLDHVCEHVI